MSTTSAANQDFSDNLRNFMRISSEKIYWYTLPFSDSASLSTTLKSTIIPSGSNIVLSNIANIALSQDTATFVYNDGSMKVYKNLGSNTIYQKLSSTISLSSGTLDMSV